MVICNYCALGFYAEGGGGRLVVLLVGCWEKQRGPKGHLVLAV